MRQAEDDQSVAVDVEAGDEVVDVREVPRKRTPERAKKETGKIEFTFEQLQDDLKEAQQERDDQRRVLERAIDRLAQIGIITNTPYCKQLYIDGKREL